MKTALALAVLTFIEILAWASQPGSPQIRISYPSFSYTIAATNDTAIGYRLESQGRLIATKPMTNVVSLLDLGSSLFQELCSITASHGASPGTNNPETTLSVEFTHGICKQTFSASGSHQDLYHLISNAPGLAALLRTLSAGNGKMYQLWGESNQVVPAEIMRLVRPEIERTQNTNNEVHPTR